MELKLVKEEADKLIGKDVSVPIITQNGIIRQFFKLKENKIVNDKICISYFENTEFCCNSELVLIPKDVK